MRGADAVPIGANRRVAAGRCLGVCLLVVALAPNVVAAQVQEHEVLERVQRFRALAMSDSTSPTQHAEHDFTRRFLHVDSIVVVLDTARVHLTLRDREHAHRETYLLIRHDLVWNVIELKVDRILRLHGPFGWNEAQQE